MSTVAEEITRISGCREDIKTAIAAKGVTVPATAKLADCPALIASITGGGGGVNSFINTGFTASGEYTYTRTFTATQNGVPEYDTVVTSFMIQGPFNFNGTFAYVPVAMGDTEYPTFDFEMPLQKDQWSTFRTTAGIIYTSTANASPSVGTWIATGNSNVSTGMLSGNIMNGIGLTGSITLYFYEQFADYGVTGLAMQASAFTVTGTALPYPQYAETSTGLFSASTNVYSAFVNTANANITCGIYEHRDQLIQFEDGPSYTAVQSGTQKNNFFNKDTIFNECTAQTQTGSANSNYTFVYGASASAYDGYRGM